MEAWIVRIGVKKDRDAARGNGDERRDKCCDRDGSPASHDGSVPIECGAVCGTRNAHRAKGQSLTTWLASAGSKAAGDLRRSAPLS